MSPSPDPLPITEIVAQQRFLRSVARQLVRDAAHADDLVQETYRRALEDGRERPRRLRAWLHRIVANLAREHGRGEARRRTREQVVAAAAGAAVPAASEPAAIAARVEMHRRLADAVLALAPAYRDVVLLHHFEGLTVDETAARLGLPRETVRTRLRRALAQLRTRLEAEFGGGDAMVLALLPLATSAIPRGLPPLPTSPMPHTAPTPSTVAAPAGGLLIGVPLAMSTTTKLTLATILTAVVGGGVWFLSGREPAGSALAEEPRTDPAATAPMQVEPTAVHPAIPAQRVAEDAAPTSESSRADRAALRLRTVWADGRPAPRIRVRLQQPEAPSHLEVVLRATSDESGELRLEDLEPGAMVVSAAGFARPADRANRAAEADGVVDVVLVGGQVSEATVRLPDLPPVRGTVVDGGGRPIAGADVWVSDQPQAWAVGDVVTRSDAQGRFELAAVALGHFAAACAEGFGWSEVVSVDGSAPRDQQSLQLQIDRPGATLRGRAQDVEGQALAGVRLVAVDDSRGSRLSGDMHILGNPPPILARSAADGTFVLPSLPFGELELLAEHPDFAPLRQSLTLDTPEVTRDLTLERGGTLVVSVEDAAGDAMADVTVQLRLLLGPMNLPGLVRTRPTDEHGEVEFHRLPLAFGEVTPLRTGHATRRESIRLNGERQSLRLTLGATSTLRAVVVDEAGQACPDVTIELFSGQLPSENTLTTVTTDSEGRFELTDCADVDYQATFYSAEGMTMFAVRRDVVLHPAEEEQRIVLAEMNRPLCSLRGRIVAANGHPLEQPSCMFAQEGGNIMLSVPVMEDGSFQVSGLPAGRYWLMASAQGHASQSTGELPLQSGEELDLGDLRLEQPATLVVWALRPDARPLLPSDLALRSGDGGHTNVFTVDGDRLRAEGLSEGTYGIEVVGDGLAWQQVPAECRNGQVTEVRIDLREGSATAVSILAAGGAALTSPLELTARHSDGTTLTDSLRTPPDQDSTRSSYSLASGDWTLEVVAADGARGEAHFTVHRGASTEVEVVLAPGR